MIRYSEVVIRQLATADLTVERNEYTVLTIRQLDVTICQLVTSNLTDIASNSTDG